MSDIIVILLNIRRLAGIMPMRKKVSRKPLEHVIFNENSFSDSPVRNRSVINIGYLEQF